MADRAPAVPGTEVRARVLRAQREHSADRAQVVPSADRVQAAAPVHLVQVVQAVEEGLAEDRVRAVSAVPREAADAGGVVERTISSRR